MRKLATFQDTTRAAALDGQLSEAEIPTVLRSAEAGGGGGREVWVVSEQDVARARAVLQTFLAETPEPGLIAERSPVPSLLAPAPAPAEGSATSTTATAPQPAQRPAQTADTSSRGQKLWRAMRSAPVTSGLMIVSALVGLYTELGDNRPRVEQLTIARPPDGHFTDWSWNSWGDLQAGQWWRLITPIFLHFHPFHLLFNVFWLRDLGMPAERYQGSGPFIMLVLLSAALSNAAQLMFGHSPNFGGLSGVVYALIGYLWARGRADPHSGIAVPNSWVVFFVVWMALGFTGVLNSLLGGGVANYCHLGGFAAGTLYGYIAAKIALSRRTRRAQS